MFLRKSFTSPTGPSSSSLYDSEAVIHCSTEKVGGWYRLKIKPERSELYKIALQAIDEMGRPISFELVGQKHQFRCYVYLSRSVRSLCVRIKLMSASDETIPLAFRPISPVEYIWKNMTKGILRHPAKFLSYYSAPIDESLISVSFPRPPWVNEPYRRWIETAEPLVEKRYAAIKADRAADTPDGAAPPAISILMTVCDPQPSYLKAAIESVLNQTVATWQLCIADDASVNPEIGRILQAYARSDDRIDLILRDRRGGISAATNDAFRLAKSALVTCLDHDDTIADVAVASVTNHFRAHPECQLLYSDEDKIDERDNRFAPYFKPRTFSPELFFSYNYINHLTVHRAETIRRCGGWRSDFDGAQDYDLVLRSIKHVGFAGIHHLPLVLYHWRAIAGSAALDVSYKPYAIEKGRRALDDYFAGASPGASVEVTSDTMFRVRYEIAKPEPRISVIIPFRDRPDLLETCVASVLKATDYPNLEIILLDNGSTDPSTAALVADFKTSPAIRVIRDDSAFNYSRLNNIAVKQATGAYVCLLNNDIEVTQGGWLRDMLSYAQLDGVGVVGAKLHYPSGAIQHAGVILGLGGVAGHAFLNAQSTAAGYFGRLRVASNYSAVTGACLLVKRDVYLQVGGLDEDDLPVAFNDIDFCIKVQALGLRNVFDPFAVLVHWESATRGAENTPEKVARFHRECAVMIGRYGDFLFNDPCYSEHLSLERDDFALRVSDRES